MGQKKNWENLIICCYWCQLMHWSENDPVYEIGWQVGLLQFLMAFYPFMLLWTLCSAMDQMWHLSQTHPDRPGCINTHSKVMCFVFTQALGILISHFERKVVINRTLWASVVFYVWAWVWRALCLVHCRVPTFRIYINEWLLYRFIHLQAPFLPLPVCLIGHVQESCRGSQPGGMGSLRYWMSLILMQWNGTQVHWENFRYVSLNMKFSCECFKICHNALNALYVPVTTKRFTL